MCKHVITSSDVELKRCWRNLSFSCRGALPVFSADVLKALLKGSTRPFIPQMNEKGTLNVHDWNGSAGLKYKLCYVINAIAVFQLLRLLGTWEGVLKWGCRNFQVFTELCKRKWAVKLFIRAVNVYMFIQYKWTIYCLHASMFMKMH